MSKNRWVVMGWLAAAAVSALAQGTKPEPARPAASAASAAWAADMERAQRAASNPMRVILEAGKIRRRVPEGEAAVAPPEAPAARRAAVRPPPPVAAERSAPAARTRDEPPVVARSTGSLDAAPVPETLPVAVTPAASAVNASEPPAVVARPADPGLATAASIPEPTAGPPVSEPALSLSAAAPVAAAAAAAKPQPAAPPPIVQPRLVSMVEPEIPGRVLDQIGRLAEVLVELVIRRDGSVASVKMLPPAPRQVQRFVVEALERWRFEPLPEERVHRVQLVFNSAR